MIHSHMHVFLANLLWHFTAWLWVKKLWEVLFLSDTSYATGFHLLIFLKFSFIPK